MAGMIQSGQAKNALERFKRIGDTKPILTLNPPHDPALKTIYANPKTIKLK